MAKRPRMGRNLDALLGGSARERSGNAARRGNADAAESPRRAAGETASNEADTESVSQDGAERTVKDTPTSPANNEGSKRKEQASTASSRPDAAPSESQFTNSVGNAAADSAAGASAADEKPTASGTSSEAASVSGQAANEPASPGSDAASGSDRFRMVGVDQIRRGSYQPRRLFDQGLLQELADSITAEGMIQPIIVRPDAGGAYELVAGERRWRAAQLAGMSEIPAIIRDMENQSVAAVSVIENIQRKDLNPLEEAAAFERLCDEFGMTHKAVAESVGRSRASVTNLMRLLELHDEVKVLVDKGELEMGHARAILGAPKEQQFDLAKDVIKRGLTVRAVEKQVRDRLSGDDSSANENRGPVVDPDIERLSQKLGETLGAAVRIHHKSSGAGKLEISYSTVSELQGILAHIK